MTEFNSDKQTTRKNGYYRIRIDLRLTPILLQLIWDGIGNERLFSENYYEIIENYANEINIPKRNSELRRLSKNGWLLSKIHDKKISKTKRKYSFSQKAFDYLNHWSSFENSKGPLMKNKEPKIEYKDVIKERKVTVKETVVGEIEC
jgi:hypothetical protein